MVLHFVGSAGRIQTKKRSTLKRTAGKVLRPKVRRSLGRLKATYIPSIGTSGLTCQVSPSMGLVKGAAVMIGKPMQKGKTLLSTAAECEAGTGFLIVALFDDFVIELPVERGFTMKKPCDPRIFA